MHCGPIRISSAMTKGSSLASVEEVREGDHVIDHRELGRRSTGARRKSWYGPLANHVSRR